MLSLKKETHLKKKKIKIADHKIKAIAYRYLGTYLEVILEDGAKHFRATQLLYSVGTYFQLYSAI